MKDLDENGVDISAETKTATKKKDLEAVAKMLEEEEIQTKQKEKSEEKKESKDNLPKRPSPKKKEADKEVSEK
jgi:hypothetical protein